MTCNTPIWTKQRFFYGEQAQKCIRMWMTIFRMYSFEEVYNIWLEILCSCVAVKLNFQLFSFLFTFTFIILGHGVCKCGTYDCEAGFEGEACKISTQHTKI